MSPVDELQEALTAVRVAKNRMDDARLDLDEVDRRQIAARNAYNDAEKAFRAARAVLDKALGPVGAK